MTTRRVFLGGLGTAALSAYQARQRKPNLLFILADDLGYGDLGCFGQKHVATPNLDRLAADGMRFSQAYAGSTVCAPSRCALMTGLHTGHARIRGNKKTDLLPEDVTIAKVLKGAGYRTGIFGKWGLGTAGNTGIPTKQGFDEWFGYLDQTHAHTYFPTQLWENEREFFLTGNFGTKNQYSPDLFTERGLKFLGQKSDQPFFLYMAYTLPHANNELNKATGNGMEVPSDEPYTSRDWPQQDRNFAAMVNRLDRDVGRLLEQVRAQGMDRDTLVIFSSDNGPHREGGNNPDFFRSSGPLKGIKRALYEGGIRVPTMARWTGTIGAGQVNDTPWAFWDVLPTAAELAGVKLPSRTDGVSLVPMLNGKPPAARDYLYWEFHEAGFSQAARWGDWKAVRRQNRSAPIEIYNLKDDAGETQDLASSKPDLVKKAADIFQKARTDSKEFPVVEKS